jgi:hypothetical protein
MASIVSLQGMKMAALEQSWSVIVRIESKPFDSGSFTMKSSEMVSNGSAFGSTVIGNKAGFVGWVLILAI